MKETSFPSCFNPNLTTCLYHTPLGIVCIAWCKNLFGHSLFIDLHFHHCKDRSIYDTNNTHFHFSLKPWLFWKKQGSKAFDMDDTCCKKQRRIEFFWDLVKAKFFSGPEPDTGFYVAVAVDGEMLFLIGDLVDEAYSRTRIQKPRKNLYPVLISRRENVFGNRSYTTKARFGGKTHDILIECSGHDEPRLSISVDRKRVLQVKRLKWKFRGNERIEVEGVPILVSWDVCNWLFDDIVDRYAVFMFRFEKTVFEEGEDVSVGGDFLQKEMVLLQQCGVGMNWFERKRMKKRTLKTNSSSSSASSASSASSSSVMEWTSVEESEMQSSGGFSLLVYAWKS